MGSLCSEKRRLLALGAKYRGPQPPSPAILSMAWVAGYADKMKLRSWPRSKISAVISQVHADRTGFRSYLAGAGPIEQDAVRESAEIDKSGNAMSDDELKSELSASAMKTPLSKRSCPQASA